MVNPAAIMKLMAARNKFNQAHPKFASFFKQMYTQGIPVGSVIEITVTSPDGTPVTANMRVQESDMELLQELKELANMQG